MCSDTVFKTHKAFPMGAQPLASSYSSQQTTSSSTRTPPSCISYSHSQVSLRFPPKEPPFERRYVRSDVTGHVATLRPFSCRYAIVYVTGQPWDGGAGSCHVTPNDRCSHGEWHLHDKRYIKIKARCSVIVEIVAVVVSALRKGATFFCWRGGSKNGARDWHARARLYLVWRERRGDKTVQTVACFVYTVPGEGLRSSWRAISVLLPTTSLRVLPSEVVRI